MSPSPVQIPVIDTSPWNPNAASELLSSATTYGFVFIENNDAGIPAPDIRRMFALSEEFFASPTEVKQEVAIASNKAGKNHGWLSRGVEKLDPKAQKRADVKEAFNLGEPIDNTPQQPLPRPLQPHTPTLLAFHRACHSLCTHLLTLFARALDLEDEHWFTARHDPARGPTGTVLRMLYYPFVADYDPAVDIRAGAHSDYGSITLLFQQAGQAGLEIRSGGGGGGDEDDWVPVPVDPRLSSADAALPILVNVGDLLEDWTGGLLKSTVHRVVFPRGDGAGRDRYSLAYFCHPLDSAELEPVPSRRVREHATRTGKSTRRRDGRVLTARDHLMERLGQSYTV